MIYIILAIIATPLVISRYYAWLFKKEKLDGEAMLRLLIITAFIIAVVLEYVLHIKIGGR